MRAVALAVFVGSWALLTNMAGSQTADPTRCESIQNQQSRAACFTEAGVPVIDCTRPRDADEAAFCRSLRNKQTNVPTILERSAASGPVSARATLIATEEAIVHRTNEIPSFDFAKARTAAARLSPQ